ncbi:PilZ domain-containing protein [Aliikangiella marina]|uniref:PilZ domain-containing protein n=1 Tax=Aliikangiella marina TaxID=1712262 RepID=A0A545T6Z0_9GAMM|nr:PilZ domain-containing protein [Aliikangiella marina]TQV72989.1 PilZ domain-containing protein [Aliikangiella marina]
MQERRAHPREIQEERVKVDVVSQESPKESISYDCFSRDFSRSGVRIHGSQSFNLGTVVSLVIHMSEIDRDFSMAGTIKWITETTEHEILAGIEFNDSRSADLSDWQGLFE